MNEQVLVKKRESVSSPPASSAQNYYKLIYQEREKHRNKNQIPGGWAIVGQKEGMCV